MFRRVLARGLVLTIFISLFALVNAQPVHAAANLTLSPSSKTITKGNNFTVSVYTNTGGELVNTLQANLSYPTSKLQFVSMSAVGGAFEIQAEGTGGSGSIRIGRGTLSPKSGSLLISKITFKAIATGSATVSFVSGSKVVRDSDNTDILSSKVGGTYTVKSTTSPPPPPPTPEEDVAPPPPAPQT